LTLRLHLANPTCSWLCELAENLREPVRVLEYGDPKGHAGGPKQVHAAVLFRPEHKLPWLMAPRVTALLKSYYLAEEVDYASFRNEGDRSTPLSANIGVSNTLDGLHVVE
jgi:hypothetical protein